MDKYEIAWRASDLPRRFAGRIRRDTLEIIELMDGGGELRALLEAMNMPTDPIQQLNVQG